MKRCASGKKKPSIFIESTDAPFTLRGERKQTAARFNSPANALF